MTLPHKPTAKTREQVSDFKSFGITHEEIAAFFSISDETLKKYYKKELEESVLRANAAVARALYKKAIGGDVASMLFWLKTRARWKTEDNRLIDESREEIKNDLLEIRKKLEEKHKKDY